MRKMKKEEVAIVFALIITVLAFAHSNLVKADCYNVTVNTTSVACNENGTDCYWYVSGTNIIEECNATDANVTVESTTPEVCPTCPDCHCNSCHDTIKYVNVTKEVIKYVNQTVYVPKYINVTQYVNITRIVYINVTGNCSIELKHKPKWYLKWIWWK